MEENKGRMSHFAGTIRLVAAVVIAICLIVLFVRWANSRRQANDIAESNSKQSSQTQKQEAEVSSSKDSKSNKQNTDKNSDKEIASTPTASTTIPSGIDDTRSSDKSVSSETTRVPEAGIGLPALYLAMISLVTYLIVYNNQLKRQASLGQK
ncbi:hypothetical protein H6800_02925 [Candidatus Nomurabacteria bacterium]|nr:hypothetical protein [Candidatus Nomurabacteria bacterium]